MKPALRFGSAAFLPVAALILAACASPLGAPFGRAGTHRLVLVLPEAPPPWSCLPDLAFELSWIDAAGRSRVVAGLPGARIEVEVARGGAQAILARPRSRGHALDPSGALYPSALAATEGQDRFALPAVFGAAEELELDWPGGYAAQVALALGKSGLDSGRFDLARLRSEAEARVGDPWAVLAPTEAARRLAAGSFRADAFREPRRWSVPLPGPGPWAPESPLAAAPAASASAGGTAAWSAWLPEGIHRFLGAEGELIVSVDAAGGSVFVRVPDHAE